MAKLLILLLAVGNLNALSHNASQSSTGFTNDFVNVSGDTMTGDLTLPNGIFTGTATVQGSAFSVGSSTFVVSGGEIGVGISAPIGRLHMLSDAPNNIPTAFTNNHFIVGLEAASGGSSGAVFMQYNSNNNTGLIGALSPSVAWRPLLLAGSRVSVQDASGVEKIILNSDGSAEFNGNVGIIETAPAEKLQISSSSTSGYSLGFAGAFQTLPTSGHEEGTMAYQLSDHKVYIATEAVAGSYSWVALN